VAPSPLQYVYQRLPVVTQLSPARASDLGGADIIVEGTGILLTDQLAVQIGTVTVKPTWVSSRAVRIKAPVLSPGQYVVRLTANGIDYADSVAKYTSVPTATVIAVTPSRGPVTGGTKVTVTGSGFEQSRYLRCRFKDVLVPAIFVSSSVIICHTPPQSGPTSMPVQVSVDGSSFVGDDAAEFSFIRPPEFSRCGHAGGRMPVAQLSQSRGWVLWKVVCPCFAALGRLV
jgi:hypothetical protein